jgi:hypothetical protein
LELRKNNLLLELDQSKKAAQTELDNLKREMSSSHKEITGILRQKEQIERFVVHFEAFFDTLI